MTSSLYGLVGELYKVDNVMIKNTFRSARDYSTEVSSEEALTMITDQTTMDKLKIAWIRRFGMMYPENSIVSSYSNSSDIVKHAWIDYCVKNCLFIESNVMDLLLRQSGHNNISYLLDKHNKCRDAFPDIKPYAINLLHTNESTAVVVIDHISLADLEDMKDDILRDIGLKTAGITPRLLMRHDLILNDSDIHFILNNYGNYTIRTLLYTKRYITFTEDIISDLITKSAEDRLLAIGFYRYVTSDNLTSILEQGLKDHGPDVMRSILLRSDFNALSSEVMEAGLRVPDIPEKLLNSWMDAIRNSMSNSLHAVDEVFSI